MCARDVVLRALVVFTTLHGQPEILGTETIEDRQLHHSVCVFLSTGSVFLRPCLNEMFTRNQNYKSKYDFDFDGCLGLAGRIKNAG